MEHKERKLTCAMIPSRENPLRDYIHNTLRLWNCMESGDKDKSKLYINIYIYLLPYQIVVHTILFWSIIFFSVLFFYVAANVSSKSSNFYTLSLFGWNKDDLFLRVHYCFLHKGSKQQQQRSCSICIVAYIHIHIHKHVCTPSICLFPFLLSSP